MRAHSYILDEKFLSQNTMLLIKNLSNYISPRTLNNFPRFLSKSYYHFRQKIPPNHSQISTGELLLNFQRCIILFAFSDSLAL